MGQRPRLSRTVERVRETWCGEVEGDGITKAWCRERSIAYRFARRVDSSSDSASSDATGVRETYSDKNVSTVGMEMASATMWQEDVTARWNKHARSWFRKFVVLRRERVEKKTRAFFVVGPLDLRHQQAGDGLNASAMEVVGA